MAPGSVDAVRVALLGRRREWVRQQGRANASLLLLAREMGAEFLPPARETDFGAVQGDFKTLDALATLSHDCRRPELFRPQLMALLKLIALTYSSLPTA